MAFEKPEAMSEELDLNLNNMEEKWLLIKVTWINLSQIVLAGIVGFIIKSSGVLGTALYSSGDMAVSL